MALMENKSALRRYVEATRQAAGEVPRDAINGFFAHEAAINIVHPFNKVGGVEGYVDIFLAPLTAAFENLQRSAYIAMAGRFENDDWVSVTGHYAGKFRSSWLGIAPTGDLEYLRYGEFHRMVDGVAVESYIYLDIPALMIKTRQWPIKGSVGSERGYTGLLPGPVSQDGLQWQLNSDEHSAVTLKNMQEMLLGLATPDEAWRGYWSKHMLWHGPAAFGAFVGIEDFAAFQVPFENTFSEWVSGIHEGSRTRHFCRMADGDYACIGGWPSLNAVQIKTFLDQPPQGERLYMRVCDWWRQEQGLLVENWVFVDVPHILMQLGLDVFPDLERNAA